MAEPRESLAPRPDTDGPPPESMMVTLRSGEIIHYLDWPVPVGLAGPRDAATTRPIVLVHGLTRTAWTWLPVARRLAAHGPVVAVDLRGHGASDAPLQGYDLQSLALDVLTVMAGQGWGEAVSGPPTVLGGHGLGALVAAEMARLQPGSVAGLALVDAGWESMLDATRLLPMQLVEAMAEPPEVLASLEAYLADRRAFDPASWDADQELAARAQVEVKHAGHVGLVVKGSVVRKVVEAMYAYQPLEVLLQVTCPVTLLVADPTSADDEDRRERSLALEDVVRARREAGLPATRVRRFAGVGHDLVRYRPAEVAEELARLATVADGTSASVPPGA